MPTASPMNVSMLTTKKLSGEIWPISAARASATTIAKIVRIRGTKAATTAPNTATRIKRAIGMPIPSPFCRSLSESFVKSFPTIAQGFGIETEMTVHALQLRMPIGEMPTSYKDRPPGSASKLRTYHDGVLILSTIVGLVKQELPMAFFGAIAAFLAAVSLILAYPIVVEFARTGLVPRFPTAILATGIMIAAFLSLTSGIILDSVTRGRWEVKRLQYLAFKGPPGGRED